MERDENLLPCPFCGGEAKHVDLGVQGKFEDWDIACVNCGITMITPSKEEGCLTTKDEASKAWNRRISFTIANNTGTISISL